MKFKRALILSIVFITLPAGLVFAHKVIVFAWVENGMIHTESQFASKRKAKGSAIIVVNEAGRVVHEGQTDQDGKYSFQIPDDIDSDLIIKLVAGTGHQAQWRLPKDELITGPSDADIQMAARKRDALKKSPSILKIISGLAVIFLLALVIRFFKREKAKND